MNEKYYAVLEKNNQYLVYVLDANMMSNQSPKIVSNILFPDVENEILGIDKGIMGWGILKENTLELTSSIEDISEEFLLSLPVNETSPSFK